MKERNRDIDRGTETQGDTERQRQRKREQYYLISAAGRLTVGGNGWANVTAAGVEREK